MSSRAKLLVSILFIAVIILCIGLTRFYFDVTKNTGNTNADNRVESVLRTVGSRKIFRSANGFCGVLDDNDAVIIEPEWMEIQDLTDRLVIVSKRINDKVLIGGIDYEENVVLPFVYRSIEPLGDNYRVGLVEEDESCIIYTADYRPALFRSYDSASYNAGRLELGAGDGTFTYYAADNGLILRKAELVCDIDGHPLAWGTGNRVFLSDLRESDLLRMNTCVSSYLQMLVTNDFTDLVQLTSGDFITPLTRPGSFKELVIDDVSGFSLGRAAIGSDEYVFSFALSCHSSDPESESPQQTVTVQLFFRRNAENSMILTSAGLDYQSAEQTAPTEAE